MKRMFTMKALAAMCFCLAAPVTGRSMERTAAAERRQAVREDSGRRSETAECPRWWEMENIDGRNEEHPAYMLPLILPDHLRQRSR